MALGVAREPVHFQLLIKRSFQVLECRPDIPGMYLAFFAEKNSTPSYVKHFHDRFFPLCFAKIWNSKNAS